MTTYRLSINNPAAYHWLTCRWSRNCGWYVPTVFLKSAGCSNDTCPLQNLCNKWANLPANVTNNYHTCDSLVNHLSAWIKKIVQKNYKHRYSAYLCQGTSYQCRDMDVDLDLSGWTPKFNHLFVGPLPTFPEKFTQISLEVFVQSC